MAEAAGLALGAVALVSLFQTAVDCLEYFEVARNVSKDQELATTKINLLEVRLKQWGRDLRIQDIGEECDGWLRMHCLEEGGLITSCLIGISNILGNASQLTSKYGLDKMKRLSWLTLLSGITRSCTGSRREAPRLKNPYKGPCQTRPMIRFAQNTTSLGNKVTWAVKDKKRFESLISELDFLITNLERVSSRLRHQDTVPYRFSTSQDPGLPAYQGQSIQSKAALSCAILAWISNMPSDSWANMSKSNICTLEDLRREEGKKARPDNSKGRTLGTSSSRNSAGAPRATEGSSYENCSSSDQSKQFNGDVDTKDGGQHQFKDQKSGGASTQLNGNSSLAALKTVTGPK